jgi:hypothetical protein
MDFLSIEERAKVYAVFFNKPVLIDNFNTGVSTVYYPYGVKEDTEPCCLCKHGELYSLEEGTPATLEYANQTRTKYLGQLVTNLVNLDPTKKTQQQEIIHELMYNPCAKPLYQWLLRQPKIHPQALDSQQTFKKEFDKYIKKGNVKEVLEELQRMKPQKPHHRDVSRSSSASSSSRRSSSVSSDEFDPEGADVAPVTPPQSKQPRFMNAKRSPTEGIHLSRKKTGGKNKGSGQSMGTCIL